MISIKNLTIVRDGHTVISNFSQEISAGSITVIIGANGSGKSTLLAAIAGDIAPTEGTITIDTLNPYQCTAKKLSRLRAMAVQNQVFTLGFTSRQVIEMGGESAQVIRDLALEPLVDRQVTTLSGGEAQRVSIAQAIAQQTPVLLLDEPLSAQDLASRQRIITELSRLARQGITVVLVAHSSESELSWGDVVIQQSL